MPTQSATPLVVLYTEPMPELLDVPDSFGEYDDNAQLCPDSNRRAPTRGSTNCPGRANDDSGPD